MTKADRVFRQEMRKLRALRKRVKREKALATATTGAGRVKRQTRAQRRYWAERRARERAKTTLTAATVRDVMAMDRDFREAVTSE